MTIYVEVAILENLIINLFLLNVCASFFKIKKCFAYLFLGAAVGVSFALIFPLIKVEKTFMFLLKIAAGFVVVYFAFFPKTLKKLFRLSFSFILLTFLLGGMIYGVLDIFAFNTSNVVASCFASLLPVLACIVCSFIFFLLSKKIINLCFNNYKVKKNLIKIVIKANGKSLNSWAFYDSGNLLKDEQFDLPVCVISLSVFEKLFPKENLTSLILKRKIECDSGHYITYNTISERQKSMFTFRPESVEIYSAGGWVAQEVLLGVSLKNLSKEGNFDVLLNGLCEV